MLNDLTVHVAARVPVDLARDFETIARKQSASVSAALRRAMIAYIADSIGALDEAPGGAGASVENTPAIEGARVVPEA